MLTILAVSNDLSIDVRAALNPILDTEIAPIRQRQKAILQNGLWWEKISVPPTLMGFSLPKVRRNWFPTLTSKVCSQIILRAARLAAYRFLPFPVWKRGSRPMPIWQPLLTSSTNPA